MKIIEAKSNKKKYIELLLLADEQEDMIDCYLERGTMYILDDDGVKAECVVTDESNCFVINMDKRYGRDTTIITKGKTTYELKDKDCPLGSLVKLCFSSDFFLEGADEWRDGCWDTIRRRSDCIFVMTTKRPERIRQCLPEDWWGATAGKMCI